MDLGRDRVGPPRGRGHRAMLAAGFVVVIGSALAAAPPALLAAPAGAHPVAESACGVGVSHAAAKAGPTAAPGDPEPGARPPAGEAPPVLPMVAGITLIPPTAAAAGIASGARGFRTTVGTHPAYLTPFQGGLAFSATDAAHGRELWVAGPTGARRLRDISPGTANSSPHDFVQMGDVLYFTASDGTHGRELWRTDGTAAGTRMVRDIRPGSRSSNPGSLYVFKGLLYLAADDGTHGSELWRSDGTRAGTTLFVDLSPHGSAVYPGYPGFPPDWASLGGMLYFPARRTYSELWRTDGTAAGTQRVVPKLDVASDIIVAGRRLFFEGSHDDGGCALDGPFLFTSDGTADGTQQLAAPEFPWGPIVSFRGRAWFGNHVERSGGSISDRPRLWRSAGTEASTIQLRPTVTTDWDEPYLVEGSRLFVAIGGGLAISDATGATFQVLGDTAAGWRSTTQVAWVGGRWYFPAGQGRSRSLWRTDGTPAGSRVALDVNARGNDAVRTLAAADGVIWFVATDGLRGEQLWRYVPSTT